MHGFSESIKRRVHWGMKGHDLVNEVLREWESIVNNNNNTQIAAVALPPSTTHPLPWAEQHTQEHTRELAPKCMLHVFTCTFTDLPRLSPTYHSYAHQLQ